MAESEDSEGEELGLIRPEFIRELRNVLDEYPDDGQILKEMIQNAEDAGASTIKIFSDRREFNGQPDKVTLKHHPHLKYFKGPALCVYNDAYFTEADWKGIRMLHTSIKEKDPMKVGRFGLGFKSVFHLTDRLVILSGDRIMYMDPFKGEDRYCNSKRLSGMKGKELQSILFALKGNCDISEQSIQTGFQGTVFWFPLRSEASELSETIYTDKNMEDLINSFRAEARSMVLFLKNIENIHLFSRSTDQSPKEIFHVGIHSSCLQQVRAERKAFIDRLQQTNGTLPQQSISSQSDLVIEIVDHLKSTKESERWILVNFYPGMKDVSPELSSLCTDPNLSYQPFVGVAMPLGGQDDFQSNLFCFLPLPLDTKSPTGLPVHINGFFALSQNRRHIKWPTADQQRYQTHLESAIRWNCLLVENLLPQAYIRLLCKLKELFTKQPEVFYSAWPDFSKAGDKWKPLLRTLYREIVIKDFFFTKARGGSWISYASAELCSFPVHLGSAIEETIVKVYSLSNENLVKLPRHIEESIQQLEFKPACSSSPQRVAALVNKCLPSLNTTEKLNLLQYLLTYQNPSELLNNLQLLPLEDGTFGKFNHDVFGIGKVYLCDEKLMEIFPGLENLFCSSKVLKDIRAQLLKIARTNAFSLRELLDSSPDMPRLMKDCLEKRFGKRNPTVPIDDKWTEHVWKFFSTTHPWCYDLTGFYDLSLLPAVREGQISLLPLNGIYVCCNVSGITSPSKDLVSCLAKLQITMLPTLPNYTVGHSQVLGHLVQYPNPEGIIAAVRKVCSDNNKRFAAIKEFNSSATYSEREALIGLLNTKINIHGIELLFQNLKLFTDIRARVNVSIGEINVIAPQQLPPVTLPKNYLMCNNQMSQNVAKMLGASEESFEEIVEAVLHLMKTFKTYSSEEITKFMKYFLGEIFLVSKQNLLSIAREVKFLPLASSQLKSAQELYDPSSQLLKELFLSEDRFPCGEFAESKMLSSLKSLGLRTERNLQVDDLITAANKIQSYFLEGKHSLANTKAQALWKFLVSYGDSLNDRTLQIIANIQCLPCLQKDPNSTDYPKDLPLMSQPSIVKPTNMGHSKHLCLIGTCLPIMPPGMPDKICQKLGVNSQVNADKIVHHLRESIKHYNSQQSSRYQLIFCEIFRFLSENCDRTVNKMLQEEACILVESEGRFARPDKFWIQKSKEDIDLTPYRYLLSREMSIFQDLFVNCGSRLCQDKNILCDVLSEIQEKHKHQLISHNDFVVDMRLVNQILDVLKRSPDVVKGNVIIPIWHGEPNVLRFRQAKDCTIGQGNWQLHAVTDNEEEIFYVHPDIPQATASLLGALNMKARALTGAEELDFGYGQREELVDRLHNLLKDSYTDGFSVPKEMIQNADDAGATELKFLLDERENKDARTNLISDQMASLQGPAIWVFNNAVFSDKDFQNIVKLGGGTKKDDSAKVGKFGLGFNSVYNLTDAPSFISRHVLAMFDPQVKYLEGPGLKLDFKKSVNRNLLKKMPEVFKPFQGIFGCKLDRDEDVNFNGSLFRFPLRTQEQAEGNKLKDESYTDTKRKEFLQMLLERAGNLLMFTQNIKKLEVYHLSKTCNDPSCASRLLTVTKRSERELITPEINLCNQSILQFCTTHWSTNKDIKLQENIEIEYETTTMAAEVCKFKECRYVTHWRVAWASGTSQSANIAIKQKQESYIPLAAAAAQIQGGCIVPIANSPNGFYTSGHLFCFLPLPEEMVRMSLPVHLNATFALSSSRRGLLVKTEDDLSNPEADWNSAIFADAICRAYLLLLETMQSTTNFENDFSPYFDLWPSLTSDPNLRANFYNHLVTDSNKVFPTSEGRQWISFQDAWFLDPDFRFSACGDIAMETLRYLWPASDNLVDIPEWVYKNIQTTGQTPICKAKVITQVMFYKEIFFPNIQNEFWIKNNRDKLVHHALLHKDLSIQDLVHNHACIPCSSSDVLQKPGDLIHPHRLAANLFLASEGCFPQDAEKPKTIDEDVVNFCSTESLGSLVHLGMITDDLPESMLLERAHSITTLFKEIPDHAVDRADKLIEYLSSLKGTNCRLTAYSAAAIDTLSKIKFLPVQRKSDKWVFAWRGGESGRKLAAPHKLYSENLKHLVGCVAKILDLKTRNYFGGHSVRKEVFMRLSVKLEENIDNIEMIQLTIKQLLIISDCAEKDDQASKELTQAICKDAYSYLNRCSQSKSNYFKAAELSQKKIVWTGTEFVVPSKVAFKCRYDCRPYLFPLQYPLQMYEPLCKAIGIKEEFTKDDALLVIEEIHKQNDGRQLSQETIQLMSRVAQLLCESIKKLQNDDPLEGISFVLPDHMGYLQDVSNLCLDDCVWLTESETMKFVHDSIPPETAKLLGVQSKRMMDYNSISDTLEFGQSEKLTTRIKRLLDGYTCDFSLFKELVQNADDAGATEIKFIKDFRNLKVDRVPLGWEALQGPALCVYNNKSFTSEDMKGIQSLGEGSKSQDILKTGKYGVGFNAVYHLTDVPSFWTREDDIKEVVCVFDPNCRYVTNATPQRPGVKFNNIERIKKEYPDMFSGYLSKAIDMTKPGTMFRLPLRTKDMAKNSELRSDVITEEKIMQMLKQFVQEINICLLFLNNLRKIGIYAVHENGSLIKEFEVLMTMNETDFEKMKTFKHHLETISKGIKDKTLNLVNIHDHESVLNVTLRDSRSHEEEWIVINRAGFKSSSTLSTKLCNEWQEEHFQLLPRGGVALKISEKFEDGKVPTHKHEEYLAFCILPLPVETKLPVHVNGHFALDHETRRNIWVSKNDARTEWNEKIAFEVIVPAYITAIMMAKDRWFGNAGIIEKDQDFYFRLKQYHNLFPEIEKAPSDFWKNMMKELYKQIALGEFSLFPVVCGESCRLEWVPVTKRNGFPGYFQNLVAFFKSLSNRPKVTNHPVVLSYGSASHAGYQSYDENWPRNKAETITRLLKFVNMKVLETPFHIFENFKSSGIDVWDVTPESVIQFLKSTGVENGTGCNLTDLPQKVKNTSLKTAANVKQLVHFVQRDKSFMDKLEELPLGLRQSENLYLFQNTLEDGKPIVTEFFNLLPGSADAILHKDIYSFFKHLTDNAKTMIRQLDIPTLASLLPNTLPEAVYKVRQRVKCDFLSHPSLDWLKMLWTFLQTQFMPRNDMAKIEERKKIETQLSCLSDWSLIPVKKTDEAMTEQTVLYPIREMQNVVFLQALPDQSHRKLWEILKTLPLPFLDTKHLPDACFVTNIVASISHPMALLNALTSLGSNLELSSDSAYEIMSYFNNCLPLLRDSFSNDIALQAVLKKLPFYTFIDGKPGFIPSETRALCLSKNIPRCGLRIWSEKRYEILILLCEESIPKDMEKFLQLESVTIAEFYYKYLLPTINNLETNDIEIHMKCIRDNFSLFSENEKVDVASQLKATAFIERNCCLYRACDFYSDRHPVLKAMCSPESFPPSPWNGWEWTQFMKIAGIVHEVTNGLYIKFASQLQNEGRAGLNDTIISKSETLANYLFQMENLIESRLLNQIRDICFIRPSQWRKRCKDQHLLAIAQPFCPERLVSFSESCSERHLYLVWSSSCIMHPDADPMQRFSSKMKQQVLGQLCLTENVPNEKVIQHIKNICYSLAGDDHESFKHLKIDLDVLKTVMTRIYEYLSENITEADIMDLKKLPVICDADNMRMLFPERVVLDLRDEEAIDKFIYKVPVIFGAFFSFFKKLGVSPRVTANHYAKVLFQLKSDVENNILIVPEMQVVKKAVEGIFRCLKSDDTEVKMLTVEDLFLPAEDECLWRSSELIFVDSRKFKSRFKDPPQGKKFFLGFKQMEITPPLHLDDVNQLPDKYKMILLSTLVREIIPEIVKNTATETETSRTLAELISNPLNVELIVRLSYHFHHEKGIPFSEVSAEKTFQELKRISLKEVTNLCTVLTVNGDVIPGSKQPRFSFADKCDGDQRTCTVYVDSDACRSMDKRRKNFIRSIAIAVQFVLKDVKFDSYLLQSILSDVDEALELMNIEGISECDFTNVIEQSIFPPPGTFIPVSHHCFLDNNFYDFCAGDYVGFEVYDPQLDGGDADEIDPVFIYAIVLNEVTKDSTNSSLLFKIYRINLGIDRGIAEVSAAKLYKIIRKKKEKSKAVMEYTGQKVDSETSHPQDIAIVLKDIRRTLIDAWKLPSDSERMRVVKRLYLRWHPDKNKGNEEFCTRVVQALQHYVDILKSGGTLKVDEDDLSDSNQTNNFRSSSSSFFEHMHRRSRRHRTFFDEEEQAYSSGYQHRNRGASNSQGYGYSSGPNPQPGEGRRWFRQAQADLSAAQEAMQKCSQGHNWICFHCHQAVEKALKAVLYYRDSSGSNMRSHDLVSLGISVEDGTIFTLASDLERSVGSYVRMRYPDVLVYPQIPADVYTAIQATQACDIASKVLKRTQDLLMKCAC